MLHAWLINRERDGDFFKLRLGLLTIIKKKFQRGDFLFYYSKK